MTFERDRLPDPVTYFESRGLILKGPSTATWKTTECVFHGGSDSMRIHTRKGAWVCMSCAEKGGDVLSYEIKTTGLDFVSAARELGAWVEDGRYIKTQKPTTLSPRDALSVLGFESLLVAVAAGNVAKGVVLTDEDLTRLLICAARITRIAEDFS